MLKIAKGLCREVVLGTYVLYIFLANLHIIPANSALIERIFSIFSSVWSNLSNKKGSEREEKLVKINRALP